MTRSIVNAARPEIWVSLFKNFTEPRPIGEVDILQWLLKPPCELLQLLNLVRETDDKETRNTIKARLPAVTPSGLFEVRRTNALIAHSGLICLDIDAEDNPEISDWNALKLRLPNPEHILYAGLSASGRGLFCLVPISDGKQHLQHFLALEHDFREAGIVLDTACKDVARLRGFSHDLAAYINFDAKSYEKVLENSEKTTRIPSVRPFARSPSVKMKEVQQVEELTPAQRLLRSTDLSRIKAVLEPPKSAAQRFMELLKRIETKQIDITASYCDWFTVGCVVATLFGADGISLFHRISVFYPRYNHEDCEKQFCKILQSGYRSSFDKIVSIAEHYGLR